MKRVLSTLALMLLSVAGFGHGQQVAYCVLPNGYIRVYIEHWHGDFPNASSIAGNSINVTTTYGSVSVTQNIDPAGIVNNTDVNNLPGCASVISVASACVASTTNCLDPGANNCDDWGYWDFAPAACNVPVTITVNAGNTVVFTEACTNLYPATITSTFGDNAGPIFNCPGNITLNGTPGLCGAFVNYVEPTVTDACQFCPSGTSIAGYTYLGSYLGHKYFQSNTAGTWASHNAAAQALGGHLATVTSAGENAFLTGVAGQAWIGLTDQASEGTFVWVTGEPVVYTNWCLGEPNNCCLAAGEDYGVMNWCGGGGWNDLAFGFYNGGNSDRPAIVEFDCISPVRVSGLASGAFFPVGTTTINYSATDNSNNTTTCTFSVTVNGTIPSCTIASTPTAGTYTDGNPNHIYLGYGDGQTTLTATPSGGSSFTYSWSPSADLSCSTCANPVFTPTAGGNYTFTATVTNEDGCSSTCTITICVLDIRVPGEPNKVYICHYPPGNPGNMQTLAVGKPAVAAHMANHGDKLGGCDMVCGPGARMIRGSQSMASEEVNVYPNPNSGTFTVALPHHEEDAQITVTDMTGKVIQSRIVKDGDGNEQIFKLDEVAKGVYFVTVTIGENHFRMKLTVQ